MRSDGTGQPRSILTCAQDRCVSTAWSPDGTTIAVTYDYVTGSVHILLYAADGSGGRPALLGQRNGADNISNDRNPSWSADSTRIAFDGMPNINGTLYLPDNGEMTPPSEPSPIGQSGMWLANVPTSRDPDGNGSGMYRPSPPPNTMLLSTTASNPSYSPDGTRIAFARDGFIWSMKAIPGFEGTDQDNLGVPGSDPSWGP